MPPTSNPTLTATCYFVVKVADIDTIGAFMSCSGLGIEYDVLQYMEGGNNDFVYQLPGHMKFQNLVLTRGLTDQDNFTKWLIKTQTEPELKEVSVTFQNSAMKSLRVWTFTEAFPIKWTGPAFDA